MRKIFSLAEMFLLTFALAACGQETATVGSTETNQEAGIETVPTTNSAESVEKPAVSDEEENKPSTGEKVIMKAEFNFETRTVKLNSGYEMPINGLGTYSLHGEECIDSVRSALESGVRLIDTASAYGNEEEIGQAIRDAIDDGLMEREELFVITKIYPGDEMENPEASIQACLDRLDIGYVDMMLLHHPDSNDVQAYKAMEQFVKDGKIRSIGLSKMEYGFNCVSCI